MTPKFVYIVQNEELETSVKQHKGTSVPATEAYRKFYALIN